MKERVYEAVSHLGKVFPFCADNKELAVDHARSLNNDLSFVMTFGKLDLKSVKFVGYLPENEVLFENMERLY